MKPMSFDYHRAANVDDAVAMLADSDWGARVLAGGQSLVPMLNLRLAPVRRLIDVSRIDELRQHKASADSITIGAAVTHGEIEDGVVPDGTSGLMRHVATGIAYRAVRNRGTIGGSISLADPSADWVTTLLALDATFEVRNAAGVRRVAAADMIVGPYATALQERDLLTRIEIAKLSPSARWGYYKVVRKAGEFAITIAAVVLDPARDICRAILGAASRAPLRLTQTERCIRDASRWADTVERQIAEALRADLKRCSRPVDSYEARLFETATVRATAQMFGVA